VADVVKLDANNRRLVAQGLKRVRAGRMQAGIAALFRRCGATRGVPTASTSASRWARASTRPAAART
jgi:single-stranded-DNA-specific exonuclease